MKAIGIGLVGTGYMGKAHAVALKSVGAVFNTSLRPVCEMICSTTAAGAARKAAEYGFNASTERWQELIASPRVEAVVIASPQTTHREIALAAFTAGKPVFCEKPLGASLEDARVMTAAAAAAGLTNMVGFNYIRAPAMQLAREMIAGGEIGDIIHVRAEHTEDFLADPEEPASWRTRERCAGNLGDLSPHIINAVLRLVGPIDTLVASVRTVYASRSGPNGRESVTNDDQADLLCAFTSGAMGSITVSRVATGRKMGYAYDITGTKGALKFDAEDQNALWFYDARLRRGRQGFAKLLTAPEHPDFGAFCEGPGHGTGYGAQIIIEARDFLKAIDTHEALFPTFQDGLEVSRVVEAAFRSHAERRWVRIAEF
ncbi:MAG TPA: Gfo/Idh/MocA family oxidoreductase [Steroidobacteraceae bacterium]|nr:Gfo/Idh/MocA family oxidoreductase [Steroidobacteraceae bacterium]